MQNSDTLPHLLTPLDVAGRLRLSRSTVYSLLRSGELDSVTVGKSRRVSSSQVQEFISALEKKAFLGGQDVI
jgi:excisionase family DNA binding protein